MQCQACGTENPEKAKFCMECGAGLQWTAWKRAEGRFQQALTGARAEAEERLRRSNRR